jgi:hypothetical protein
VPSCRLWCRTDDGQVNLAGGIIFARPVSARKVELEAVRMLEVHANGLLIEPEGVRRLLVHAGPAVFYRGYKRRVTARTVSPIIVLKDVLIKVADDLRRPRYQRPSWPLRRGETSNMDPEPGAKPPAAKAPSFFSIPFLGASAALERAVQVPGERASTEAQALMAQVKLRLREVFLEAAQKSVRSGVGGVNASGEVVVDARAESGTDASTAQGAEEIDALSCRGAERLATSQPNRSTECFIDVDNAAASERHTLESVNTPTDALSAVGNLCDILQNVLEHGLRQNVPGWDLGLIDGINPEWRKGGGAEIGAQCLVLSGSKR